MINYQPLLQRLDRFVRSEAETRRQDFEKQWSRPLAERVASGPALEGVRVEEIRKDGILVLTCATNDLRFREGIF